MDLGGWCIPKKGIAVPLFLYTKIDHLIYDFPLLLLSNNRKYFCADLVGYDRKSL